MQLVSVLATTLTPSGGLILLRHLTISASHWKRLHERNSVAPGGLRCSISDLQFRFTERE